MVIGGYVRDEGEEISAIPASVIMYNPQTDSWATATPLPVEPQYGCTAVVHDDSVVIFVTRGPALRLVDGVWQELPGLGLVTDGPCIGSMRLG